ncbi:GTP-binding protein [Komagataeibacter sp. AV436]|uniref:GTP-binding protein n=1 Tax=Komagataeibacter melomenusus TaxID=2766578 RepID=A0ABX2AH08_9PROT|nr:GTP-binding protein [Komagataeibacter melomenusus]MBV1829034.1 GTP-binding protein [Komagataeibacter melomenusus]NPC67104.1 GTP-binding protein [Komagataeibacter melomenusus]
MTALTPPAGARMGAVPVIVIGGFLGAGKTTFINRIINSFPTRKLSAVVNDFGAIDIDADLINLGREQVIPLRNGCICCSLQGDMLSTIRYLLDQPVRPDGIIIECSGVSQIGDVKTALLDAVFWKEAALDSVICVADGQDILEDPAYFAQSLRAEQFRDGDFIILSKMDQMSPEQRQSVRERVLAQGKRAEFVLDNTAVQQMENLLFSFSFDYAATPGRSRGLRASDAVPVQPFASLAWESDRPIAFDIFQQVIGAHAPTLLRAKGILYASHAPETPAVFQMVGNRVTVGAGHDPEAGTHRSRIVFIGYEGQIDLRTLRTDMDRCVAE